MSNYDLKLKVKFNASLVAWVTAACAAALTYRQG